MLAFPHLEEIASGSLMCILFGKFCFKNTDKSDNVSPIPGVWH